ncbi:YgiT-type zinc finger protein [Candidatus Magnetominusculus xianensis]|uniref:YgiT-type zinc finger domain-containing protein n=1 Tax=Candidatus Magnetominusculus xianensis TaxID=1748249 RepID=A0ABR5SJD0_9BACT|nr:YgiT-type zinc finger protein [Candidatus Magnetominusculus xianensis]KWT94486.1 YgiT-type zinc finger domain-containing protein [Candidatus Magnetominusculus xianensis]MBF0405121.1 YgiT-type zinc finger protein [Nitrospirota bacterium]
MICEFCTGNTIDKKVRRQHWLHGKLYIVENVDAEVCTECGERYFHVKTLEMIDRMLGSEHEVKERIGVEIVTM